MLEATRQGEARGSACLGMKVRACMAISMRWDVAKAERKWETRQGKGGRQRGRTLKLRVKEGGGREGKGDALSLAWRESLSFLTFLVFLFFFPRTRFSKRSKRPSSLEESSLSELLLLSSSELSEL